MLLKMYALSGAAIILWIVPLYSLDKRVSWHRFIQGGSLVAAFSCASSASFLARRLVEEMAFENAKKAMLIGDMQDELAQSAWLSEQQRRLQNEQYLAVLANGSASSNGSGSSIEDERLERPAALGSSENVPENVPVERGGSDQNVPVERVQELRALGWSKAKVIESVWGVSKGGSSKYKSAEAEYEELVRDGE